jgi:hypothetical protein
LLVNLKQVFGLAGEAETAQAKPNKKWEQFFHLHSFCCSKLQWVRCRVSQKIIADSSRGQL